MVKNSEKSLPENLKTIRLAYRLTQQQVADLLGIDRTSYTNYELGKINPRADTLVRLARVYQIPVDSLVYGVLLNDNANSLGMALNQKEKLLVLCYRLADDHTQTVTLDTLLDLFRKP